MFFITVQVMGTQTYREVMSEYGLSLAKQGEALRRHNDHLKDARGRPPSALSRPDTVSNLIIPIDPVLHVIEFESQVDMVNGVQPQRDGVVGNTHGIVVRIGRNYGTGAGLNWIQTVFVRNHEEGAPQRFVDGGGYNEPYYYHPGHDYGMTVAPAVFRDAPSGPIAPSREQGKHLAATTTLSVTVGSKVILAAAYKWDFTISTGTTRADGIIKNYPVPAGTEDMDQQVTVLKDLGFNVFKNPTGRHLDYIIPGNREIIR